MPFCSFLLFIIFVPLVSGGAGGKQYLEVKEASSTWGCRRQGGAGGKQWVSGGAGGNCRYLEVQEETVGIWRCRRKL